MSAAHPIANATAALQFVLAGNARFTIRSKATGTRYTYRVRQPKHKSVHFVQVLTGPDNENAYEFFGTVFDRHTFRTSHKSRIGEYAPSVVAFKWFWRQLTGGKLPDSVECWHEGRCGRCGRTLTVPESLANGLGPECVGFVMEHAA